MLLRQKRQRDKRQQKQGGRQVSDNDSVETEQSDQYRKEEWRYQNLCLIIALSLSILSVVLFLLTQDMSLPMGWVDTWTIVNIAILAVEIISLAFVFKKKSNEQEDQDKPASNATTPF